METSKGELDVPLLIRIPDGSKQAANQGLTVSVAAAECGKSKELEAAIRHGLSDSCDCHALRSQGTVAFRLKALRGQGA